MDAHGARRVASGDELSPAAAAAGGMAEARAEVPKDAEYAWRRRRARRYPWASRRVFRDSSSVDSCEGGALLERGGELPLLERQSPRTMDREARGCETTGSGVSDQRPAGAQRTRSPPELGPPPSTNGLKNSNFPLLPPELPRVLPSARRDGRSCPRGPRHPLTRARDAGGVPERLVERIETAAVDEPAAAEDKRCKRCRRRRQLAPDQNGGVRGGGRGDRGVTAAANQSPKKMSRRRGTRGEAPRGDERRQSSTTEKREQEPPAARLEWRRFSQRRRPARRPRRRPRQANVGSRRTLSRRRRWSSTAGSIAPW